MSTSRLFIFDSETNSAVCIAKGYSDGWLTGIQYIDEWMADHYEYTGDIKKTRFKLLTEQEITKDIQITFETKPNVK